jgi:hypothetical protein
LSNDVQRIGVTMKSSMQLRALLRRVTTRAEGTGRKKDRPPAPISLPRLKCLEDDLRSEEK